MIRVATSNTTARSTGNRIDRNAVTTDRMSSPVLTTGLAIPAVDAVITGRAVLLMTCTVPATSKPHTIANTGWTSAMALAFAANRIAPAMGGQRSG